MAAMTNQEHSRLVGELVTLQSRRWMFGEASYEQRKRELLKRLPNDNEWHIVEGVL